MFSKALYSGDVGLDFIGIMIAQSFRARNFMAIHDTRINRLEPEGPNLQDVLDSISELRADLSLHLDELKKIVQLLRDLPIDLERRE